MAPVLKRFTMADTGSTSSRGTGCRPISSAGRSRKRPRNVPSRADWSSTAWVYCLKMS